MVPSRCVKSEYMKCFKEPKWEACGPYYQELLRYRLSRRLLEQAHRPWFWDDWEQDSSLNGSSGSSPSSQGTSSPPVVRQAEEEAAHPAGEIEVPGGDLDLGRISAPGEDVAYSPELAKPPGGPGMCSNAWGMKDGPGWWDAGKQSVGSDSVALIQSRRWG